MHVDEEQSEQPVRSYSNPLNNMAAPEPAWKLWRDKLLALAAAALICLFLAAFVIEMVSPFFNEQGFGAEMYQRFMGFFHGTLLSVLLISAACAVIYLGVCASRFLWRAAKVSDAVAGAVITVVFLVLVDWLALDWRTTHAVWALGGAVGKLGAVVICTLVAVFFVFMGVFVPYQEIRGAFHERDWWKLFKAVAATSLVAAIIGGFLWLSYVVRAEKRTAAPPSAKAQS